MRFIPDKDIPAIEVPKLSVVMSLNLGRIIKTTCNAHALFKNYSAHFLLHIPTHYNMYHCRLTLFVVYLEMFLICGIVVVVVGPAVNILFPY